MFAINTSHLHKAVIQNILKAMREAQQRGHAAYVNNRKGSPFIRVEPVSLSNGMAFEITDSTGRNIKDHLVMRGTGTDISKNVFKILVNRVV